MHPGLTCASSRQRGFTLLEILLVVVIIGVMAGMAVLAVGNNDARYLQQESERLLQVMRMAQDEAILKQENLGLYLTREGYQFLSYNQQERDWTELSAPPFATHRFQLPLRVDLSIEGSGISLQSSDDQSEPQLVFLSSGENSVFILTLALANRIDADRQLYSDGFSPISLQVGDEKR